MRMVEKRRWCWDSDSCFTLFAYNTTRYSTAQEAVSQMLFPQMCTELLHICEQRGAGVIVLEKTGMGCAMVAKICSADKGCCTVCLLVIIEHIWFFFLMQLIFSY